MTIKLKETRRARKPKAQLSANLEDMSDEELCAAMDRALFRFSTDPNEYDQDFADRMQSGGVGISERR